MILKRFIITFITFVVLGGIPGMSQNKQDYNWVTGFYYVEGLKRPILDFGTDTLQVKDQLLPFAFSETNSCISDEDGNLLLYFNGCDIANGRHEILENGSGFNAGIPGDFECPKNYGYPGPYQSALILRQPGEENIYYLFYARYDDTPSSIELSLRHAKVDISHDNGKGIVLFKDVQVSQDSVITMGRITAVRHANNEDWWIILFGRSQTNEYHRVLLTSEGLFSFQKENIGITNESPGGQASFSPDGTKYMRYSTKGLSVMDYDRENGILSNHRFLSLVPESFYFGGTFSPNGRFIYLSDKDKIYQVDTWEEELSLDTVEVWDGHQFEGWRVLFGMMQTGPDCRIYVASLNCLQFVHIIMNPDEKGAACNVKQRALDLKSSSCGFPHFPNFRLGTPDPYCDPNKVVITGTNDLQHDFVMEPVLFPNPTYSDFTVRSEQIIQSIEIYDTNGKLVYNESPNQTEVHMFTQDWLPGMYFVQIKEKDRINLISTKLVIIP